jgi:hypothetical protein
VDTYQFECPQNDIINCIDVITEVINSIFFFLKTILYLLEKIIRYLTIIFRRAVFLRIQINIFDKESKLSIAINLKYLDVK